MRQYARFKASHPDCLLLFRMGDFYELFDDDAVTAHKALGITLTERSSGIPMAGVPHHAVESYLRKLIDQGFRVAVCDQIQDPKEAKGIVDRAVTRVLTPGTLVDESLLDEGAANQVAAVQFLESGEHARAALAIVELSTGRFEVCELAADEVVDEVARLAPSELIYTETADGVAPPRVERLRAATGCALTPRPAWTYRQTDARELLLSQFGVSTLHGFGLEVDDPVVGPAGALVRFLRETQAPDAGPLEQCLQHLAPPRRRSTTESVAIDASSLQSLEIERTMRTGQTAGSLLSVIQACRTAMGRRMLRRWLCFPVRDLETLQARQDAVGLLRDLDGLSSTLAEHLDKVQDVARIVGRLGIGRATPRDLVALGRSILQVDPIVEAMAGQAVLTPLSDRLRPRRDHLHPLALSIQERCNDEPPTHLREGGLFRDGVDGQLDEARSLQRDATTWLAEYQKSLVESTGIPSLKVGYNRVFGYYIELTAAHADKAPATFTRKQTLKNAERFITPELKDFEDRVTTAETRAIEREKVLFERLTKQAMSHAEELTACADLLAELDVLLNFAHLARRHGYIRPTMVDSPTLEIDQGRHPVLSSMLGEQFVPNDTRLGVAGADGSSPASLALITGPNMAGKSTYIRQVAIIVLLAHTGSFIPAESATIGLVDRIFTRIGASDELHAGKSTFMVEMTETANILHHATSRSLIVLDEIGRGTSTLDGLSLAWAIAESVAKIGARALFATHYHELTTLAEQLDNVTNLHVAVREWGEDIIFLYRILPGRTDRSYGIHVARIAGLPATTIRRASDLLETLAVQTEHAPAPPAGGRHEPPAQMELFREYVEHPVVDELRRVDLNAMTPLDAFDALRALVASLEAGNSGPDSP